MSTDDKYGELRRLDEIVNRIAAERGLPWDKRPFDEIPEAERKGMADALREWSALSAVAAQEGLIPTSYGSAAVTPSLSSARHPIFVTEHHLNEVRKCFERLVKKYAGADFRNTNTEAGCIWNDAVNLANGINATHSASAASNSDAQDAARYRHLREQDDFAYWLLDELEKCGYVELSLWQLHFDGLIDQHMAKRIVSPTDRGTQSG